MFDTLKLRYEKNWCRIDQLAMYVRLGVITAKEYEEITGETYEASTR